MGLNPLIQLPCIFHICGYWSIISSRALIYFCLMPFYRNWQKFLHLHRIIVLENGLWYFSYWLTAEGWLTGDIKSRLLLMLGNRLADTSSHHHHKERQRSTLLTGSYLDCRLRWARKYRPFLGFNKPLIYGS